MGLFAAIELVDFTGNAGSATTPGTHLGKVLWGWLKLDASRVVRKLLKRIDLAEDAGIKENGRDWSKLVRDETDEATNRGDVPAAQSDLGKLRRNLMEFGAARTRRLSIRHSLNPDVQRGGAPRGLVAEVCSAEDGPPPARVRGSSSLAFHRSCWLTLLSSGRLGW